METEVGASTSREPRGRRPTSLLVAVGLLALSLLLLTWAVASGWSPLRSLDGSVASWGHHATLGHPVATAWWLAVAACGQPLVLRVLALVVAALLAWRGDRRAALWLVLVTLAETVVAPISKLVLRRARPDWGHAAIAIERSTSYPSGHATAAATFATALAALALLAGLRRSWERGVATVVLGVLAAVICADRIFLGVHYLSDVVAGILLGVLITTVAWLAWPPRVVMPASPEHP